MKTTLQNISWPYTKIILALLTALVTKSIHAQTWDPPSYQGEAPVSGSTYYMYNVGSEGFLNRGGQWGTMAVVSATPRANASTATNKWTCVNTTGSVWTFQYNNNGTDISENYLFTVDNASGDAYTDNSTNNTYDVVETDTTNHIYSIQIPSTLTNYVSTEYVGTASTTETTNKGIANTVRNNRSSANEYIQWKFISEDNYSLYQAKVVLDRYMQYAQAKGGIDLTAYITTYNNDTTSNINTAASMLLTALGRTDVSDSISNAGFESDFTDWTNGGSFAIQTNNPGQGWTKDNTKYAEKYIRSPSNLAAGTITQTVSGIPNGLYELVVDAHAVQQGGSNPLNTGAFITCGASSTEVSSGNEYLVSHVAVSDSSLTIGYSLEGTVACNWTGFDNFRLYYYGTPAVNSDATLSSLSTDQGEFTPAFSSGVTSYTVFLPSGTTSVTASATATDPNASVSGTGAVDVRSGSGSSSIVVTAEDGTTQITYTVN